MMEHIVAFVLGVGAWQLYLYRRRRKPITVEVLCDEPSCDTTASEGSYCLRHALRRAAMWD